MKKDPVKRKILIVNTTPFGPGGIAKIIASYYKELCPGDLSFDIVANNSTLPEDYRQLFSRGNSQVFCFPRKKGVLRYVLNFFKVCFRGRYDVIHVHGNSATMAIELMIAWLCGIKQRIAHCHTNKCEHPKAHKLLFPLFSRLYTKALACSPAAGEWIFGPQGFLVLNNAFSIEDYRYCQALRDQHRQALGIPENTLLLGHIGYFNPTKRQDFLIDLAAALVPHTNIKLALIGIGAMKTQMERYAETMGVSDSVLFLGERNDVAQLLQAIDLFLFPSEWEGLGLALIEAQLSGLNCIASDRVPPETDLCGNVRYLPLEDPQLWATQLRQASQSTSRAEQSDVAIAAAEKKGFSIRTEAAKLEALYR